MKRIASLLLVVVLLTASIGSALAATKVKPNKYSIPKEGTVLQDVPDRGIKPKGDSSRHTMIPGESPTTGLPWSGDYLPMIMQISNSEGSVKVNGKTVKSAGIGERAPWGGQYADIVFEGILYRTGATRISFLFSDSFIENQPTSAGPVRSARIGHVLLREEWESGFIYAGGPRKEENNIKELFAQTGADEKGVLFDLLSGNWLELKYRVKGVKAPDNYNANVLGFRQQIPPTYASTPRPFLFADESPYTQGYEFASTINLDWGDKKYISHFFYDEAENLYLRFSGDAPYMTFASAEDRSAENQEQMSFSNVIIQRVNYEYVNNNKIMPNMQSIGQGNADIFIGGRYIPGYWVRKSINEPTVFYDDQGSEIQLTRGKTFIAHFPPESLLTFTGIE
ncbi:MAG: DUF3048 domain-containing protein [Clostridiales bacterium]|nr:DUF3048 domain-containing protein [Clostridiales bacterium]